MITLYRFHWDYGRMGDIDGVFAADDADVKAALGKTVWLGSVLGKHSEVCGELEEDALTVLSTDQAFIKQFIEIVGPVGYDPLEYIEKTEENT